MMPAALQIPAGMVIDEAVMAMPEARRTRHLQQMYELGRQDTLNVIGLILFKAGLSQRLSEELMKTNPETLWAAYEEAQTLERVWGNPNRGRAVAEVVEIDATQEDEEIAALASQIEALRARRAQRNGFGGARPKNGQDRSKWKTMTCHYCDKKGHPQKECFKRKRDKAPMVDWRQKMTKAVEEQGNEEPEDCGTSNVFMDDMNYKAFEQANGKKHLN